MSIGLVTIGLYALGGNTTRILIQKLTGQRQTPTPHRCLLGEHQSSHEISKFTDLAKGLPNDQVFVYIVQHSDGSYEEFFVPLAGHPAEHRALMDLSPEDKIVNSYVLIARDGRRPPMTEDISKPTSTPVQFVQTINLAEGIPEDEICVILVRRNQLGQEMHQEYLIPADRMRDWEELLNLSSEDMIVKVSSLSNYQGP